MAKWEYYQLYLEDERDLEKEKLIPIMNSLGKEGWELVSSVYTGGGGRSGNTFFFFKRPKNQG